MERGRPLSAAQDQYRPRRHQPLRARDRRLPAAIPGARASVIGDKVIVEGDGLSDFELLKIDELSRRYPQIVNFSNRQGWEKMILLDVKIAEFPVSELREHGIKWTPAGGGAIGGIWAPFRRGSDGPYQVNIPTSGSGQCRADLDAAGRRRRGVGRRGAAIRAQYPVRHQPRPECATQPAGAERPRQHPGANRSCRRATARRPASLPAANILTRCPPSTVRPCCSNPMASSWTYSPGWTAAAWCGRRSTAKPVQ